MLDFDRYFRLIHIIGAIVAVGGVVSTDILFSLLHFKPHMAPLLAKISGVLSLQVWLGFIVLGASGIFLALPRPWLAGSTMFRLKMLGVFIVFLNGVFLNQYADPRFRKYADEWASKKSAIKKFEKIAGVSAAISAIGWWGTVIISYLLVRA